MESFQIALLNHLFLVSQVAEVEGGLVPVDGQVGGPEFKFFG